MAARRSAIIARSLIASSRTPRRRRPACGAARGDHRRRGTRGGAARAGAGRRRPAGGGAAPGGVRIGWGHGASRPSPPAGAGASSSAMPTMPSSRSRDGPLTSAAASTQVGGAGAVGRAVGGERAGAAGGLAGVAHPPAVEDHLVRHDRPVALGHQRADGVLDLDRILLRRPAPAAHEPAEVRVDGDAGDVERVAEDHVGGLAPDAGQLDQLLERVRAARRRAARRPPRPARSASWPCCGRSRWNGSSPPARPDRPSRNRAPWGSGRRARV